MNVYAHIQKNVKELELIKKIFFIDFGNKAEGLKKILSPITYVFFKIINVYLFDKRRS